MWYTHKFFKYITGIILVLLTILLLGKVNFVLIPIRNVIATLFLPLILSLILYYLLRPMVRLIEKFKLPKVAAILIVFVFLIAVITFLTGSFSSVIINEANQLFSDFPQFIEGAEKTVLDLFENNNVELNFISIEDITGRISKFIESIIPSVGAGIISGISAAVTTITLLLLVPFILFYLLKDDTLFNKYALRLLPEKYQDEGEMILDDVDKTLSSYIIGQAIISLIIAVLMYIGYLIIGIKYALILAIFSAIMGIVPFIGAYLGIVPALLIGLSYNPIMLLKVFIVMQVVENIQGNFVKPQIMGRKMNIHPVTVILVVIAATTLCGFVGILLAIPAYAVIKVVSLNLLKFYRLSKNKTSIQ